MSWKLSRTVLRGGTNSNVGPLLDQRRGSAKQPFCFEVKDGELFAFAGLWDGWKDSSGQWVKTCSILTTTPNAVTSAIYDRMPVILEPESYDLWLDPGMRNVAAISELLKPYDARLMRCYPVSSCVNHVADDDKDCSRPVKVAEFNLVSSVEARTKTDMKIAARVSNTSSGQTVEVETEGRKQSIAIAPKSAGRGSSVNGGELLFAALATCFCNDLYREAAKCGIDIQSVSVEVTGTFGNPGAPARDISYRVQVIADVQQTAIDDLIRATDSVTEIQNTLRAGCDVRLEQT